MARSGRFTRSPWSLLAHNVPQEEPRRFNTGRLVPAAQLSPDALLTRRRDVEENIFVHVERHHLEPILQGGFANADEFLTAAHRITNRRKARSGRSLELHLAQVFRECGVQFECQAQTELRKKPDFLFPSGRAYHDARFPAQRLRMLAAKTCCKDRWRQVASEADRIEEKHLFTLQRGVSENQLDEMLSLRVQLVIPESNRTMFPTPHRPSLMNLSSFVTMIADMQQ